MIQVICQKLTFGVIPAYDPLNVLKVYDPGSIQILEINTCWDTRTLALLTPGLGQMKNLQKLISKKICRPLAWGWEREMEVWCIEELFSQFSELHKLQHLYLNDVYFLYEHQVLGESIRDPCYHLLHAGTIRYEVSLPVSKNPSAQTPGPE